jgi:hypothetical protein
MPFLLQEQQDDRLDEPVEITHSAGARLILAMPLAHPSWWHMNLPFRGFPYTPAATFQGTTGIDVHST